MLLFKFGYRVHFHEYVETAIHIHSARNLGTCNSLFRPTISGLCAMLLVQNTTYFFFLFPPISLGHSMCGYVYVWVYIARFTVRQQFCDFLGFFFTHVCQRSIISQIVSARNEFHTWDCQRHIFLFFISFTDRNARCSGIVDSLNSRCNKYCV